MRCPYNLVDFFLSLVAHPCISFSNIKPTVGMKFQSKFLNPIIETPAFKQWFSGSKVVDGVGQPLRVYHGTTADFDSFAGLAYFTPDPEYSEKFTDGGHGNPNGGTFGRPEGAKTIPVYLKIGNPLDARPFGEDSITGQQYAEFIGANKTDKFFAPCWSLSRSGSCLLCGSRPPHPGDSKCPNAVNRMDASATFWEHLGLSKAATKRVLLENGYDGVFMEESFNGLSTTAYVTLNPNQVKSAIGNSGGFTRDKNLTTKFQG